MKINNYKLFFGKTSLNMCLTDHQKGMQEKKEITIWRMGSQLIQDRFIGEGGRFMHGWLFK